MIEYATSVPGIISIVGILLLIARRLGLSLFVNKGEPSDRWIQIIISFIVLLSGLYIILSQQYSEDVQNWAFGTIGLVIGYWLPSN